MQMPKKSKHRKLQKGRHKNKGVATSRTVLNFGDFGLKALESRWITSRQVESARRTIVHHFKRGGKLWIRIFTDKPVTIKGAETPMGKGKGAVDHYVAAIKPGTILFEVAGVPKDVAKEALRLAGHKLPTKVKFISK